MVKEDILDQIEILNEEISRLQWYYPEVGSDLENDIVRRLFNSIHRDFHILKEMVNE